VDFANTDGAAAREFKCTHWLLDPKFSWGRPAARQHVRQTAVLGNKGPGGEDMRGVHTHTLSAA